MKLAPEKIREMLYFIITCFYLGFDNKDDDHKNKACTMLSKENTYSFLSIGNIFSLCILENSFFKNMISHPMLTLLKTT